MILILATISLNLACINNDSNKSSNYLRKTYESNNSPFKAEVRIFNYPKSLNGYYLQAYSLNAGKDGNIYFGVSNNKDNAHLCKYEPGKKAITDLGSIKNAVDTKYFKKEFHGKIHVGPYQDIDGAVYFVSSYPEDNFYNYSSPGRLFRYTEAKGIQDLGIMLPRQSYYFMHGDDENRNLYFTTARNSNFIVYDLKTGTWEDKGKFSSKAPFIALTDKSNRLYIYGYKGLGEWETGPPIVVRYDPESDKLETTSNAPPAPWVGAVTPDNNTVFTTNYRKTHLYRWNLSDWPDFKVNKLGPVDPEGRSVYSSNLSLALVSRLIVVAGTINPEHNNDERIHGIWGYHIDTGKKYLIADLTDLISKSIGRNSKDYEIYWTNTNTKDKYGWIYVGFYTNKPEGFHVGRLLAMYFSAK